MSLFLIKLILSFVVGGAYIAFTIWVSERFGSKVGGIMVGLPSTSLASIVFIAWTQGREAVLGALSITPVAFAAGTLFLVAFIILYRYGIWVAYWGGLLVWALLTFPFVLYRSENLWISVGVALLMYVIAILFFRTLPHRTVTPPQVTMSQIIFRIIFSGAVVVVAVALSKALGPVWGGLFAGFPAGFSSSILILQKSHGINFASSVAKTMPYGSMGCVLFVVVIHLLSPFADISTSILVGYVSSLGFGIIVNRYI